MDFPKSLNSHYHLLYYKSPNSILVFNKDFIITGSNLLFHQLTSLQSKDVIGRNVMDVFPFLRENRPVAPEYHPYHGIVKLDDTTVSAKELNPEGLDVHMLPVFDLKGNFNGGVVCLQKASTFDKYKQAIGGEQGYLS